MKLYTYITITSVDAMSDDRLMLQARGIDLANNLSIIVTATNQNITFHGEAGQTDYQTILGQVVFVNDADEPGNRNITIDYTLDDDILTVNATSTVQLVSTNDPVFISFYPTKALAYDEETGQSLALFQSDTLSDSDGDRLENVTISIDNLFDFNDMLMINVSDSGLQAFLSNNSNTAHTLTLNGSASLAVYQAVLRSVYYVNRFPGLNTNQRNITLITRDGMTESPPQTVLVDILPFDDPPMCYFNELVSLACNL